MKKLTPYYAYRIQFSIREHFISKYNIIDYKWKFLRPQEDTFDVWDHRKVFYSLANYKIKSVDSWIALLITAYLYDKSVSFFDILAYYEDYDRAGVKWRNHIQNMPHIFKEEITPIIYKRLKSGEVFGDDFPGWLLQEFMNHSFCVESFIIIKLLMNFGPALDGNANYEYLYREQYEKYEVLLNISTERYRKILLTIIKLATEKIAYEKTLEN